MRERENLISVWALNCFRVRTLQMGTQIMALVVLFYRVNWFWWAIWLTFWSVFVSCCVASCCARFGGVFSFIVFCPTKQSTNFSTRVNTCPVVRIFHVTWVPRGVALALLLSGSERGYVAASTFLWFGSFRFVDSERQKQKRTHDWIYFLDFIKVLEFCIY